jgi:hypothetical protein
MPTLQNPPIPLQSSATLPATHNGPPARHRQVAHAPRLCPDGDHLPHSGKPRAGAVEVKNWQGYRWNSKVLQPAFDFWLSAAWF